MMKRQAYIISMLLLLGGTLYGLSLISYHTCDPLTMEYQKLVQTLCESDEQLKNEAEVLGRFPALQVIKKRLKQMQLARSRVHELAGGPAPLTWEAGSREMAQCRAYGHKLEIETSVLLHSFQHKLAFK